MKGPSRRLAELGASAFLALSGLFSLAALCARAFPVFGYLQYPWRFLGVFNLMACAAFCAAVFPARGQSVALQRKLLACIVPLLCVLIYADTIPPQRRASFGTLTREGIRRSGTTLDHENKYLPVGSVLPRRLRQGSLLELPAPGAVKAVAAWVNDYTFEIVAESRTKARFHQFWFEGWRASVDGDEVPLVSEAGTGVCRMELPEGTHTVRIRFCDTPLRAAAKWLSIAAAVLLLGVLGLKLRARFFAGSIQGQGRGSPQLDSIALSRRSRLRSVARP